MRKSQFAQFAAEASKRMILGELIKYSHGEWLINKVLISPDKRLVAVMNTLTVGYLKWGDGKVVDTKMGLVANGFPPAASQ